MKYLANSCCLETVKIFLSPKSTLLHIFVEFTFLFNLKEHTIANSIKLMNVAMCKILTSVFSAVLILRFPERDVEQFRDEH
jgi:type III secretory pathway component EscS